MDLLFARLTTWLAPVLVFTMEDVWLERFPGDDSSVHLVDIPETPMDWRDDALAEKWATIRRVRRVVTNAIEPHREAKTIGASLEAAPTVFVSTADAEVLKTVALEDVCITSAITVSTDAAPADAFTAEGVEGIAVSFAMAEGEKCQRCWKILPDVGTHSHAGVCGRCNAAVS